MNLERGFRRLTLAVSFALPLMLMLEVAWVPLGQSLDLPTWMRLLTFLPIRLLQMAEWQPTTAVGAFLTLFFVGVWNFLLPWGVFFSARWIAQGFMKSSP